MQMINKELGGTVHKKEVREDGQHTIEVEATCPLFEWVVESFFVLFFTLNLKEEKKAKFPQF